MDQPLDGQGYVFLSEQIYVAWIRLTNLMMTFAISSMACRITTGYDRWHIAYPFYHVVSMIGFLLYLVDHGFDCSAVFA